MAIELNGPQHLKTKQKASDDTKRIALEEAGIPLLKIPADQIPSVEKLRKIVDLKLSSSDRSAASGRDERIEPTL